MRYTCERCDTVCYTTDPPHLCPDVLARYRRRKAQRDAVEDIIAPAYADPVQCRAVAEAIVTKLAQMGVEQD